MAGLSTTVNRIHEAYSSAVAKENDKKLSTSSSSSSSLALHQFFARHCADIVCLQEHKIPKQRLVHRSEPRLIAVSNGGSSSSSKENHYESFWSCCVDETKKGLNGVVTYARTGTVLSADAAPLCSPELDNQGRCVMTHHGTFVLFNVYVPCAGGGPASLGFKMKFLHALRRSMQKQRVEKGMPVILVGDLNIAFDRNDVFWKYRSVPVNEILGHVATVPESDRNGLLPSWMTDLVKHWSSIETALSTKEVVSTVTANSLTRETYNKFRLVVTVVEGEERGTNTTNNRRRVFLGNHELTPDDCVRNYNFAAGYSYWDDELGEHVPAQEPNAVGVAVLAELMAKICHVAWTEATMREIADYHATSSSTKRLSPTRAWLHDVLHKDGMIDAFRHFYPTAQARYTCWNQNKNHRYANEGTRIDYTLIDASLLSHLKQGCPTLRCCRPVRGVGQDLCEQSALQASTANGLFQPASFDGGGISEASQQALDSQFGPPHTGHVYTPPTFSDHIGVSVLLDDAIFPSRDLQLNTNDATTRKAQPHTQQKSIAAFFQTASEDGGNETKKRCMDGKPQKDTSASKRSKPMKVPAHSVLHHFKKGKN